MNPSGAGGRGSSSLKVYVDGAARGNPGPAGIGAVLAAASGRTLKTLSIPLGVATNNVAESCALLLALQEAVRMGVKRVEVFSDSELLVRQLTGAYRVRDEQLRWLHVLLQHLVLAFERFEIRHLPRQENRRADRLANRAVSEALKKGLLPKAKRKPAAQETPQQPTFF